MNMGSMTHTVLTNPTESFLIVSVTQYAIISGRDETEIRGGEGEAIPVTGHEGV
jgi:hypothetical protein